MTRHRLKKMMRKTKSMDSLRRKLVEKLIPPSTDLDDGAAGNGATGSYSESVLRQYWMPDQVAVECYDCACKFTTFRRKHHCRICGQIFCSKCCGTFISGRYLNVTGTIRVCNDCHKGIDVTPPNFIPNTSAVEPGAVVRRRGSTDENLAQRFSHLATKSGSDSDLTNGAGGTNFAGSLGSLHRLERRKSSYAGIVPNTFMSESFDNISDLITPHHQHLELGGLLSIWQKLTTTHLIQTRAHRYKMKTYHDTFLGEDLLHWLEEHEGIEDRRTAIDLAQALLDGELIIDPTSVFQRDTLGGLFHKSVPYKLKERKRHDVREDIAEENENNSDENVENDDLAPDWLQSIENHKKAIEMPRNQRVEQNKTEATEKMSSPANHEDLKDIMKNLATIKNSTDIPCPALDEIYSKHHDYYLEQLLSVEKLDREKWKHFIMSNCERLLQEVEVEPSVDRKKILMDITEMIKIKCISRGQQSESRIVKGEVFSNRVVRTDMPMSSKNVKLLLVEDSISYHRPDKFVSIGNLHLQEEEFVKNICNKIKALKPDLILVGENIVRLAQDELSRANISVIQNVKEKNLIRVARFFGAQILPSLGSLVNIPTLGVCDAFDTVYYEHEDKSLVYLESSILPKEWGCSFVLRGGTRKELAKVKRVMRQFLLLKTHAIFEKAFILEESSQVDHFITPDYSSCHITQLCLSPFIELPLPSDELIKTIDADCASQGGCGETDKTNSSHYTTKLNPLVLSSTIQTDVKVRNLLADLRSAPTKRSVAPAKKRQKQELPAAPKLYDILNRSLPVSFCSYLSNPKEGGSRYCVKPWVSFMRNYRDNDLPLGFFLLNYCFDKSVRCLTAQDVTSTGPSTIPLTSNKTLTRCTISMGDHGRRFCLGTTSISLIMHDLSGNITSPEDEDRIVMWKFCPECQTMSDLVPLSQNAWKMSYGMFLLLLINEKKLLRRNIISCPHPLHNFQFTCFGRHNQIAFFKIHSISPHGVKTPPLKIRLPDNLPKGKEWNEELVRLSVKGSSVYGQINEKLVQLQSDCDENSSTHIKNQIKDLIEQQALCFEEHRKRVESLRQELEDKEDGPSDPVKAQGRILMLKISIINDVSMWKQKLFKFFELKKKEDRLLIKGHTKTRVASGSNLMMNLDDQQQQHVSLPPTLPISNDTKTNNVEESKGKGSTTRSNSNMVEQELITLDNPFPDTLHPELYYKPFVLVDENQPSSIIAYALGSTAHAEFLFRADAKKSWDHQFCDNNGYNKFFVKVHFATEFHGFRKKVFDSKHDHTDFIASLSGCDPWQSSGGKSGASFYKTSDGRFLLKQINKHEIDTLKNVAYKYFDYITSNESLMAKIVGLYTVGFKTTNGERRLDVVVMENLFYNRKIIESFDLKGSMRNRLVDSNNVHGKELVLMDENLLRMACEKPFYVSNETKVKLKKMLDRDAQFLREIKVMDYSLLVGKDDNTNELIVGIIDYLRPYSIDKIIESSVKKTHGYFQGNAEDPTVISPSAYQSRFISAMDSYFVLLPDYWYDSPPSSKK